MFAFFSTRSVFMAMASSSLLAGCATNEFEKPGGSLWAPLSPPELQIRGLSPPAELTKDPQPYGVEVKNGAGDVLFSGEVGKIEMNVPLWKLDGTYVITTVWTNRTTTTQTLKAPPEQRIDIVYDRLQELPQRRYQLVALAAPPPGTTTPAPAQTGVKMRDSEQTVEQFLQAVELSGGYGRWSDKATPADPTPHLVNGSAHSWKATLGVKYSW
jgi:hypothetical protein